MTTIDLMKTITVSYFKAHMSEQFRKVRKGATLVISDRQTPVAEVVPYRAEPVTLAVRAPRRLPFELERPSLRIDHDPLQYLLQDREAR
jgi:antitoxin (DNA-binding transcriptional repressor) of toxin-antitoxin stability system